MFDGRSGSEDFEGRTARGLAQSRVAYPPLYEADRRPADGGRPDAGPGDGGDDWDEGYPEPEGHRLRRFLGRTLVRLGWLAAVVAMAFGSAGIVAATQHFPALGDRPELTWGADQEKLAELDHAIAELRSLSFDVDGLGETARSARAGVQSLQQVQLDAAIRTGNAQLSSIQTRAASVAAELHCGDGAFMARMQTANRQSVIDLFTRSCAALKSTAGLSDDWSTLVDGSQNAMQTASLIGSHDDTAGQAVQLGSQGRYKQAIAKLGEAKATLDKIQLTFNTLSQITDVWTLGQWLDRSRKMDDALGALWQAMLDSNGRVTQKVRDALKAVDLAKQALPPDRTFMTVVLQEIGTAGINQAAISIETARGQLSAAVQGISDTLASSDGA